VLSRTTILAPMVAAATIASSLLLAAGPSANAADICLTAPAVNSSATQNSTSATSKATIVSNPCSDGVEAAIEVFYHPTEQDVTGYGGDVKAKGSTSTKTEVGVLIKYGYRYFANKNGTAQWYYEWFSA
jgi:hypothetical protein